MNIIKYFAPYLNTNIYHAKKSVSRSTFTIKPAEQRRKNTHGLHNP